MIKNVRRIILLSALATIIALFVVRTCVPTEIIRLFVNPRLIPGFAIQQNGCIFRASTYELEPGYVEYDITTDIGKTIKVIQNSHTDFGIENEIATASMIGKRVVVRVKRKPVFFQGSKNEYYAISLNTERELSE